jgi:hypothetical protein
LDTGAAEIGIDDLQHSRVKGKVEGRAIEVTDIVDPDRHVDGVADYD